MNNSYTNDMLDSWNRELVGDLIPSIMVSAVLLILGTIGNSTVIYIYLKRMKQKKNRYYIPYLALVDLIAAVSGCVFSILQDLVSVKFPGFGVCQIFWFLGMGTTTASALLLLTIAIQRYMLVCKPHSKQMTSSIKRYSLVGVAILSAALSVPMLLFFDQIPVSKPGNNTAEIVGTKCDTKPKYTNSLTLFIHNMFLLSFSIIFIITLIVFYVLIAKAIYTARNKMTKARQQNKNVDRNNKNENIQLERNSSSTESRNDQDHYRKRLSFGLKNKMADKNDPKSRLKSRVSVMIKAHKFSWMFMTITIVWIVTFMPRHALMVEEAVDPKFWSKLTGVQMNVYRFMYRMYLVNHIVNPLIYGYHDNKFRNYVKQVFFCRC